MPPPHRDVRPRHLLRKRQAPRDAFTGDTWFGGATFSGDVGFSGAAFSGSARFGEAQFNGNAGFDGVAGFGRATTLYEDILRDGPRRAP
ncbi:pentapeptide repeat-containing protein [Actinomadura soli]|uniref:pentapeptide repeat-containing protein n=1 Tax=Actinomadura soli TaxID=2508997 RepID=UPI0038B39B9F